MDQLSYCRHRFPPPIIQHAIWLYLRFTLSYRDVEELPEWRGGAELELMRRIKAALDPQGVLNPGKLLP